jgi:starvation-inducible outer membrane lipoprotein
MGLAPGPLTKQGNAMKTIIVCTFALLVTGCAAIDRTLDVGARGVHTYCASTTPEERMIARARFQQRIYPHTAQVECYGRMEAEDRPL